MALGVADVLGWEGPIALGLPGWEPRPAQLDMALAVEDALRRRRHLMVEAGTGTGKTLAYLVPAILSGQKVVISTGTRNLQEQILKKDLPLLAAHLQHRFTAAGLKGISNYLCIRRTRDHAAMQQARGTATPALGELLDWAERTASGDRAELSDLPDDSPLWREVSATPETRIGPRCPHFEDCFVTRARRQAQSADLLVVNHHLFFADLALKAEWPMAQLLPAYDVVIFDEAHQLEDVATDYFGLSVSSLRLTRFANDLRRAADSQHVEDRGADVADHLERVAEALWSALRPRLPREGRVPSSDVLWQGEPTSAWLSLDDALTEARSLCASSSAETLEAMEAASSLARRAQSVRDHLATVAERNDRHKVYWIETRGRGVFLNASPIDVAGALREHLLDPIETVIFTSATLAAGGSFAYVKKRLGLEDAAELRLEAPFDYSSQALLYLPRDLPEPQDPAFAAAAAERILELLVASDGRAFLLFTSTRQMHAVHRLLATRLARHPWPIFVQGDRPKHLLVEAFRARPAVLFATASFWEGVDVAGDALQLVVIDKLPFAPPDDPLVAARLQRIEEDGGDGFGEYQIPQAALALAQGFGRLIRTRSDHGAVALLDRRATTRSYGKRVLASLPSECPRTALLDDVCDFFHTLRSHREHAAAQASAVHGPLDGTLKSETAP